MATALAERLTKLGGLLGRLLPARTAQHRSPWSHRRKFRSSGPDGAHLSCPWVAGAHPISGLVYAILSGALASGLGYAIWYAALPGLTAAQGASVQLSVAVITAIGGTLILGEVLSLRLMIASAAVLGGIALIIFSSVRRT
jgi:hypothetical protein